MSKQIELFKHKRFMLALSSSLGTKDRERAVLPAVVINYRPADTVVIVGWWAWGICFCLSKKGYYYE